MNLPEVSSLIDVSFIEILASIDLGLAEEVRSGGCPHCGGVLHRADYLRKPRGVDGVPDELQWRLSFCCANCRKRVTPPSVRFPGRKVYWAVVILLLEVVRANGVTIEKAKVQWRAGVSTICRWRKWWERLRQSTWWLEARARILPPLEGANFIGALYERFLKHSSSGAKVASIDLLKFISPVTVPSRYSAF